MTGTAANRGVSSGVGPLAAAAIVGAALLAIAAAAVWLSGRPAPPPERLEAMGCRDLAAAMLDGSDAERRAALSVYVKKKCI